MKRWQILRFFMACAGTAAIEFGALAPILMMTSFGIYEFGRWSWAYESLQEAVSRGARCAAIGQASCEASGAFSSSNTISYVQGVAAGWGMTVPTGEITVNNSTTCGGVSGFSPGPDPLYFHQRGQQGSYRSGLPPSNGHDDRRPAIPTTAKSYAGCAG